MWCLKNSWCCKCTKQFICSKPGSFLPFFVSITSDRNDLERPKRKTISSELGGTEVPPWYLCVSVKLGLIWEYVGTIIMIFWNLSNKMHVEIRFCRNINCNDFMEFWETRASSGTTSLQYLILSQGFQPQRLGVSSFVCHCCCHPFL